MIYEMDKQMLKEILLAHKHFCGLALRDMLSNGIHPSEITYRVSGVLTDRFIEMILMEDAKVVGVAND
jgi:hypothetical protein